jgi:hypothetical protein
MLGVQNYHLKCSKHTKQQHLKIKVQVFSKTTTCMKLKTWKKKNFNSKLVQNELKHTWIQREKIGLI